MRVPAGRYRSYPEGWLQILADGEIRRDHRTEWLGTACACWRDASRFARAG
jgi:hypothetical protein